MLSAGMVRSLLRVVVSVFDFFREFGRESEGMLQKKFGEEGEVGDLFTAQIVFSMSSLITQFSDGVSKLAYGGHEHVFCNKLVDFVVERSVEVGRYMCNGALECFSEYIACFREHVVWHRYKFLGS